MLAAESECLSPEQRLPESVFPLRPEEQTRWGIVVAGADGVRRESLFSRARSLVESCISPEHTIVVSSLNTRARSRHGDVGFAPPRKLLLPMNRGTAPAVLLCLFHILDLDSEAMAAVLPCSDRSADGPTFTQFLEAGFRAAAMHPASVIRILAQPGSSGAKLVGARSVATAGNRHVATNQLTGARAASHAENALDERAPTLAMVGYAVTLLRMLLVRVPELYATLRGASVSCDEAGNLRIPASIYSVLPVVDLFDATLSSHAFRLVGARDSGPDRRSAGRRGRIPRTEQSYPMPRWADGAGMREAQGPNPSQVLAGAR